MVPFATATCLKPGRAGLCEADGVCAKALAIDLEYRKKILIVAWITRFHSSAAKLERSHLQYAAALKVTAEAAQSIIIPLVRATP